MVAASPDLALALYEKSVHQQGSFNLPESWYAHLPGGQPAHPPGFANVTVMQPTSTEGWVDSAGAIGPNGVA